MAPRTRRRPAWGIAALAVLSLASACGGALETSAMEEPDGAGAAVASAVVRSLPCGPRHVLETVCQECHSDPPKNGAPYRLRDLSDIVATRDGEHVYTLMIAQLERRRMPLPPVTITDDERALLLAWLREGAPAVTPRTCP